MFTVDVHAQSADIGERIKTILAARKQARILGCNRQCYLEEAVEGVSRPVHRVLDEVGVVLERAERDGPVLGVDATAVRLRPEREDDLSTCTHGARETMERCKV